MKNFKLINGVTIKDTSSHTSLDSPTNLDELFTMPEGLSDEAIALLKEVYTGMLLNKFYRESESQGATRTGVSIQVEKADKTYFGEFEHKKNSGSLDEKRILVSRINAYDKSNTIINQIVIASDDITNVDYLEIDNVLADFNRRVVTLLENSGKSMMTYFDYLDFIQAGGNYENKYK
mgnify:FL=1